MFYCGKCRNFFKEGGGLNAYSSCPILYCDSDYKKINDRLYNVIDTLNSKGHLVRGASLERNSINILFNQVEYFKDKPVGFDTKNQVCETYNSMFTRNYGMVFDKKPIESTLLYYPEENIRKTDKELSKIVDELTRWVISIDRPMF
jgi:hypothetical protein